ncbi:hypothetical protein niasHS_009442 [Heterodera schachtii]|uniref:DNA-directed DNA polymerase n=1 Tax=Heterodera schachtii TaxID=97005 RepID=A0ABD2JCC8_HETSC
MPIEENEEKDVYRIVVWDSETSQDTIYKGHQKEHVINYISDILYLTTSAVRGRTRYRSSMDSKSDEKKKISVYNIVSLYPSVNYGTAYPIGLPEIIIPKSDEINVNWTGPEDLNTAEIRGDITSLELAKALECGYTVDRFYRAWHYEEEADDLFKGYVRLFLKLKQEASGFPKGVETEEQKDMWREEYKEKYMIEIDLKKVKKNPGLRYISKLMLNNLWMCDIVEYSDEAIKLIYRDKEDFVTEHKSSNIVISLWTTSMARLKLLEFIREAEGNGGEILYTDTDSIFVLHDRDVEPITTGKFMGQMSEEYGGYEIEEYCCGGAKQYALKMKNKQTGETEYVMKIRGLHSTEMVLNYGKGEVDPAFFVYKNDFGPTRDSKVVTREKHKMYKPVCQKGIIDEELNRWAIILLGYDFDIEYKSTSEFGHADILSRLIAKTPMPDDERIVASITTTGSFVLNAIEKGLPRERLFAIFRTSRGPCLSAK